MVQRIQRDQVEHIAHLARLQLSAAEINRFRNELSSILSYMEKLSELDTSDVEPLPHPLPVSNMLRPDQTREGCRQEQALQNAPQREGSFFGVPKVIDQEALN